VAKLSKILINDYLLEKWPRYKKRFFFILYRTYWYCFERTNLHLIISRCTATSKQSGVYTFLKTCWQRNQRKMNLATLLI